MQNNSPTVEVVNTEEFPMSDNPINNTGVGRSNRRNNRGGNQNNNRRPEVRQPEATRRPEATDETGSSHTFDFSNMRDTLIYSEPSSPSPPREVVISNPGNDYSYGVRQDNNFWDEDE
ncbi:hypothetical protein ACQ4LE_000997 [Meloidogyne hapla]